MGGGLLVSTSVNFDGHYKNYLKEMNRINEVERQSRIEQAYSQFKERKSKQQEEVKRIQEAAVEKIQKADQDLIEIQFKDMTGKLTGKGSALANKRIQNDYVGLLASSEFKEKLAVEFIKDNMYIWRIKFNLQSYDFSKNLKEDFEKV